MRIRTTGLLLAIVVSAGWTGGGALAGGPGQAGDTNGPATDTVHEIRMIDTGGSTWRFEPAKIEVHRGDVVRFIQDDVVPHNVEFKDTPAGAELGSAVMGPFLLEKGATYEVRIDERFAPGTYDYVCTPHAPLGMVATLEVAASGH